MSAIRTDDDCSIHYRLDGASRGPTLVFSNSLGTDLHMWDEQVGHFAERFRILRYDTRGHGHSGTPSGPYSIERLGRDVLNLLDALELDTVSWCGLSLGGMIGMWLGCNAPARLQRMALCNTSAHMPPPGLWNRRIELARAGRMDEIVDGVIGLWFTPAFRERAPAQVQRVRGQFLTARGEGYAGCCEAIRDMDQRESIRAITVPVLVIAGADDPATPPEHARLIAERIAGARYVEIPQAAHLSNIEQPARFDAALESFLAE